MTSDRCRAAGACARWQARAAKKRGGVLGSSRARAREGPRLARTGHLATSCSLAFAGAVQVGGFPAGTHVLQATSLRVFARLPEPLRGRARRPSRMAHLKLVRLASHHCPALQQPHDVASRSLAASSSCHGPSHECSRKGAPNGRALTRAVGHGRDAGRRDPESPSSAAKLAPPTLPWPHSLALALTPSWTGQCSRLLSQLRSDPHATATRSLETPAPLSQAVRKTPSFSLAMSRQHLTTTATTINVVAPYGALPRKAGAWQAIRCIASRKALRIRLRSCLVNARRSKSRTGQGQFGQK